jgi:hypothetical protein
MVGQSGSQEDRLLTEVEAAGFLRLSIRTLQAWRCERRGPAYVRAGRAIRYRLGALIAWMSDNTVMPQR